MVKTCRNPLQVSMCPRCEVSHPRLTHLASTAAIPLDPGPTQPESLLTCPGNHERKQAARMSNRQPFQLDLHQIHTRSQQPNAHVLKMATSEKPSSSKKDTSKVHKLSLKGSAKLVAEFVCVFAPLSSALPPSGRRRSETPTRPSPDSSANNHLPRLRRAVPILDPLHPLPARRLPGRRLHRR